MWIEYFVDNQIEWKKLSVREKNTFFIESETRIKSTMVYHFASTTASISWMSYIIYPYNLPRLLFFRPRARTPPEREERIPRRRPPTICIRRKGRGGRGSEQNELASRSSWASPRGAVVPFVFLLPLPPLFPLYDSLAVRSVSIALGGNVSCLVYTRGKRTREAYSCTSNHINHAMVHERFL